MDALRFMAGLLGFSCEFLPELRSQTLTTVAIGATVALGATAAIGAATALVHPSVFFRYAIAASSWTRVVRGPELSTRSTRCATFLSHPRAFRGSLQHGLLRTPRMAIAARAAMGLPDGDIHSFPERSTPEGNSRGFSTMTHTIDASAEVIIPTRYFVVGSWSNWEFEEMISDGLDPGVFYTDIILVENGGEFQIVGDEDWNKVLHPVDEDAHCAVGTPVAGPDSDGHGLNWVVDGQAGDKFRIVLHHEYDSNQSDSLWRVQCNPLDIFNPFAIDPSKFLEACEKSGRWQAALAHLEDMRLWHEPVNEDDSEAVLRSCQHSGAWQPALKLLEDLWGREKQCVVPSYGAYAAAMEACRVAGEEVHVAELSKELEEWGPIPDDYRFQLTPRVHWNRDIRRLGCSAANALDWNGDGELPQTELPCWLLPASDVAANAIAHQQDQLRQAGWKVITSEPHVLFRLDNKAAFQDFAAELGLAPHLPAFFKSAENASYPCILKPATGEFGKDTHIVHSCDDVLKILGELELDNSWVLQEFIPGPFEFSASLLVDRGEILEVACVRYEYSSMEYVWPNVRELGQSEYEVIPEHLAVMRELLVDYSGFCNFNYKLRSCGQICIFEANTRVGADLACDVPRPQARAMFERLDKLLSSA